MVEALALLLAFQVTGEVIARSVGLPVPGPVIGMLLLFLLLLRVPRLLHAIDGVALQLLRHLSLFFVPAAVGIMTYGERLSRDWLPIAVALVLSTWIALAVGGWVMRLLAPRNAPDEQA
ncbi:MAG: CidA/LrgA family protein [Rhodocyclaceae bacterium]|nr:CidA/LrgA family protein [Rhodocyclaceae bacterium]MBX3671094.1 CidA/LrgA family protein [Rhodocyclaceae bacterium]